MRERGRYFWRVFLILLVISMLATLYFSLYLSRMITNNSRENQTVYALQQLNQTCAYIDASLAAAAENADYLLRESQDYLALSSAENGYENTQLTELLESMVRTNCFIQSACLYVPRYDIVYSSTGTYIPLSYSMNEGLILQYLKQGDGDSNDTSEWISFYYADQLYLVAESMGQGRAFLFAGIDRAELLNLMRTNISSNDILIYDEEGYNLDFTRNVDRIDMLNIDQFVMSSEQTAESKSYYRVDSYRTGWHFLMKVEDNTLPLGRLLLYLMPVTLIYLLLSVLIAWWCSHRLSMPLQKLLTTVGATQRDMAESTDEMEYLGEVYQGIISQNEHIRTMMQGVSEEVLDSMLTKLLYQQDMDEETLRQLLQNTGHEPWLENSLAMGVVRILYAEQQTSMERYFLTGSLREMLNSQNPEKGETYILRQGEAQLTWFWFYPQELPAAQVLQELHRMEEHLHRCSDVISVEMHASFVRGRTMAEIGNLYMEVSQRLDREMYFDESRIAGQTETDLLQDLMKNLQIMAEASRREEAERSLNQIRESLRSNPVELAELQNTLVELLLGMAGDEEMIRSLSNVRPETLSEEDAWNAFRSQALNMLFDYSNRIQYRYVRDARQYIQDHCINPNLGLDDVAEKIGVSGRYLSTLIREQSGETFVSYVNQCRVEKAKSLLAMTTLTTEEVGFRSGFNTFQNFNRVFKKHTLLTPNQYRKKSAGEHND